MSITVQKTVVLETHEGGTIEKITLDIPEGWKLPSVLKWQERYFELFDTDGVYRETRYFLEVK